MRCCRLLSARTDSRRCRRCWRRASPRRPAAPRTHSRCRCCACCGSARAAATRPTTDVRRRTGRAPGRARRRRSYRPARVPPGPASARRLAMSSTRARVDIALERTAERHRDRRRGAQSAPGRIAQNFATHRNALVDGLSLIARTERIGRRHHHADFLQPSRRQRAIVAAAVQDQTGVRDVAALRQALAYRLRVGHLRHTRGMHEAGHFDAAESRRRARDGSASACRRWTGASIRSAVRRAD